MDDAIYSHATAVLGRELVAPVEGLHLRSVPAAARDRCVSGRRPESLAALGPKSAGGNPRSKAQDRGAAFELCGGVRGGARGR